MLRVSQRILISAPRDSVRRYLRDLENIPRYERKARLMTITGSGPDGASLCASGRFLGLPWRGEFRLEFTPDGGYRAEMVRGPLRAMTASFHLRPVAGWTQLTHEEHYHFPLPVRPLQPWIRSALSQTLESELRVIKEGAELAHRRSQLEDIGA